MQPTSIKRDNQDFPFLPQQRELAHRIEQLTLTDGLHSTAINAIKLARFSQPTEAVHGVHEPAICFIAQGQKRVTLGDEEYIYNPTQYLVVSVDLPVVGQVFQATPSQPYLSFRLNLDPQVISDLLLSSKPAASKTASPKRGLFLGEANASLLDTALRIVRLLDTPDDVPVLAPLLVREMIYRLLQDEHGGVLRQIALTDSHTQQIAKAIQLIKQNFAHSLRIEDLARVACMSNSSLHMHFKAVTSMTPLQDQKQLRLQEARRLLLTEKMDAASASHKVGYESPSQFSREYHRLFGLPPARDLARLREQSERKTGA